MAIFTSGGSTSAAPVVQAQSFNISAVSANAAGAIGAKLNGSKTLWFAFDEATKELTEAWFIFDGNTHRFDVNHEDAAVKAVAAKLLEMSDLDPTLPAYLPKRGFPQAAYFDYVELDLKEA